MRCSRCSDFSSIYQIIAWNVLQHFFLICCIVVDCKTPILRLRHLDTRGGNNSAPLSCPYRSTMDSSDILHNNLDDILEGFQSEYYTSRFTDCDSDDVYR
ncbi:MAG: hypothetical protein [Cressdnaviricota sp.]|nr:MAG: hypothetical protein [Cressdnaviricota sp.]